MKDVKAKDAVLTELVMKFWAHDAVPNRDPVIVGAIKLPVTVSPAVYLPEPLTSKLNSGTI